MFSNSSNISCFRKQYGARSLGNSLLYGSTLVEVLIMMLVSGIVLLVVMDGLLLFFRLQTRQMETLFVSGLSLNGLYRTEQLISSADSVIKEHCCLDKKDTSLQIWRNGRMSTLQHSDSVLLFRDNIFIDTLLHGVSALNLMRYDIGVDSVSIYFSAGVTVCFPVLLSAWNHYRIKMRDNEDGYEYKEK